jgi:hypothetical protein
MTQQGICALLAGSTIFAGNRRKRTPFERRSSSKPPACLSRELLIGAGCLGLIEHALHL